jgi:N-acetylmuramoyl-L-alanine amidase
MANQYLNDIHTIVIHCSATKQGLDFGVEDIDRWHKARGWSMVGYHRIIRLDGTPEQGRPFTRRGAHVKGNNTNTLGFCLIGGLDSEGKPKNTFTYDQWSTLLSEILRAKKACINIKKVLGHRDFSPDLNGDGLITPDEWMKECPCVDISHKMREWRIEL